MSTFIEWCIVRIIWYFWQIPIKHWQSQSSDEILAACCISQSMSESRRNNNIAVERKRKKLTIIFCRASFCITEFDCVQPSYSFVEICFSNSKSHLILHHKFAIQMRICLISRRQYIYSDSVLVLAGT